MTFKIQCQSHSSKSYIRYDGLLTIIPFVLCWSALQCLRYSYLKNWPWKSKFKVMGEVKVKSHNVTLTSYRLTSLSFHVNRPSHSWDTAKMGEVKVESHNMGPTFSRLTSLSFHVTRASHSWVMTFWKFDLENQGSRSWARSQFKVTMWIQHLIGAHPFHSMSIGHLIPELRLFQNLTLKIKRQCHGWGHSSKLQCGSNVLSAHILFIPCQSDIRFLSYDFFQNLTLKIKGQGHGWGHSSKSQCGSNILSIHIPFFHVNRPSHSWDTAFSKFDHENPRSGSNDHDVAQLQV